ncbi:hypothetical protein [Streptomyces sp. NPDC006477]|uniref:hypothetical protein n=1 Tax=Streptomyces sp. NPDC006477 TaxID=3364747 RepID=UPI003685E579
MDPSRVTHRTHGTCGSVVAMRTRRLTLLVLAAFLTSGCVAVPTASAPRTPVRAADLAPAADRPPAPLPTWPVPTQAPAREALAATDPRPAPPKPAGAVPPGAGPASTAPAPRRPPARPDAAKPARRWAPPPKRSAATKKRKAPKASTPSTRRTSAKPRAPKRQQPRVAQTPEMRRLCRQAQEIQAPMGAAELCRGLYGR